MRCMYCGSEKATFVCTCNGSADAFRKQLDSFSLGSLKLPSYSFAYEYPPYEFMKSIYMPPPSVPAKPAATRAMSQSDWAKYTGLSLADFKRVVLGEEG